MSESILPANSADVAASPPVQEDITLPEALQAPTRSKSLGWQLGLSLANLVVWMCTIPLFEILLPNQIAALAPTNKVTLLAIISLVGGITAILGNLLAGALSDRTTSRFGRRRPWIIIGALLSALSLVLLGLAPSIPVVALGVILFQFSINIDIASLAALVPDQVPLRQRATVSAFAGLALPLGTVIGLTLIAQVFNGAQLSYYVLAGVLIVILALFVLLVRDDTALPKGIMPAFALKAFLVSFVRPLKIRDFSLTFVGRILVIFGYYTVVGYLLYYLQDAVHDTSAQATQGVAIFQVLATGVLIIATNGKDLGILNTANLLPQILVPIVVGIVIAVFHSYSALFLIGAIAACVGGALIFPVKSVR